MDPDELDEVPLTEQEKNDIAEAWVAYIHALPADREPDLQNRRWKGMFNATVNRVLAAHDFEPFTAQFVRGADDQLVLCGRRLPTARPIE